MPPEREITSDSHTSPVAAGFTLHLKPSTLSTWSTRPRLSQVLIPTGASCEGPSAATAASRPHSRRHSADTSGSWARPLVKRAGHSGPLASPDRFQSTVAPSSSTSSFASSIHFQVVESGRAAYGACPSVPKSNPGKRQASHQDKPADDAAMEPTYFKKPRTGSSPPRRFEIPPAATCPPASSALCEGPSSPLFFSHTPSRQPGRPTGSSPGVTTSMLSGAGEEPSSGVTTVKLPHAAVKPVNSAISGRTPGSLVASIDMSAPALSPDVRIASPSLQSIGVLELVEQDDRPTFLIDMLNPTQSTSNQTFLHIL